MTEKRGDFSALRPRNDIKEQGISQSLSLLCLTAKKFSAFCYASASATKFPKWQYKRGGRGFSRATLQFLIFIFSFLII